MSAVRATPATSPVYLRLRKHRGGQRIDVEGHLRPPQCAVTDGRCAFGRGKLDLLRQSGSWRLHSAQVSKERRTIGELSRRTGVPVKTLWFYSDEGLLALAGRISSRYRLYAMQALVRVDLKEVWGKLDMEAMRRAGEEAGAAAKTPSPTRYLPSRRRPDTSSRATGRLLRQQKAAASISTRALRSSRVSLAVPSSSKATGRRLKNERTKNGPQKR
jgi:hypothetical protein